LRPHGQAPRYTFQLAAMGDRQSVPCAPGGAPRGGPGGVPPKNSRANRRRPLPEIVPVKIDSLRPTEPHGLAAHGRARTDRCAHTFSSQSVEMTALDQRVGDPRREPGLAERLTVMAEQGAAPPWEQNKKISGEANTYALVCLGIYMPQSGIAESFPDTSERRRV
jgi:hypothetical protein